MTATVTLTRRQSCLLLCEMISAIPLTAEGMPNSSPEVSPRYHSRSMDDEEFD
jgi:hypothetical protein